MNIYYKNINVSTTNHFTLVDKAIYSCTREIITQKKKGSGCRVPYDSIALSDVPGS